MKIRLGYFDNPVKKTGALIMTAMIFIAIFAPLIAPFDPQEVGVPYMPPSAEHLLGTNDMGQDILSGLLYASRVSLKIGFLAATISTLIGISVGAFAGYFRGLAEDLLMGLTNVFLLIPGLPMMIILSAYLKPGIWNIVLVISLLWWCPTARVVHSKVLQIREAQYVESTRALGYGNFYILTRHIIPNTKDIILTKYSLAVASAMISEASLSFIGLGSSTELSWGKMISFAFSRGGFAGDLWWWYLSPGLMICICVLGFIMISMEEGKKTGPEGLL